MLGAFSVVQKAVRKRDGLIVAIKRVDRTKLNHVELENLKREVSIMQEFLHPHVLHLLDVFDDEPKEIHLVTECKFITIS
jgi:serine/threonine protein kinase